MPHTGGTQAATGTGATEVDGNELIGPTREERYNFLGPDVAAIHKDHVIDPDSNYCFGEGGAGTFSDGKLYTRSTNRGDVSRILDTFVTCGADEDILVDAHPHIGTNKLPQIIINIRQALLEAGAEIHFESRVTELWIEDGAVRGVRARQAGRENDGRADDVILATGHSARDVFELLHAAGLRIESKPFAMGVRVEHAQTLIDSLQYHCRVDEVPRMRDHLPAASYSVAHQADGRGVYSFCMCPGGVIAPCATAAGEVVTNGWSPSKRNNPWASSGVVVSVEPADFKNYREHGPSAGLRYQQAVERLACEAAGGTQTAPAHRLLREQALGDFACELVRAGHSIGRASRAAAARDGVLGSVVLRKHPSTRLEA